MPGIVTDIWRHPIKSHGREALAEVALTKGTTLPWDRVWAVAHEASGISDSTRGWRPVQNFVVCARAPELAAINATVDESAGTITLTHPRLARITVDPDIPEDRNRLIEWVTPLAPPDRARPVRVYRAGGRGLTDTEFPSVSILSRSSLDALSAEAGQEVAPERWRGNIWVEGFEAWSEFGWVGRRVRIGGAELRVIEPIQRCRATTANPETGRRDLDTLALLDAGWGHRNFGVYAEVAASGRVRTGDPVTILG